MINFKEGDKVVDEWGWEWQVKENPDTKRLDLWTEYDIHNLSDGINQGYFISDLRGYEYPIEKWRKL